MPIQFKEEGGGTVLALHVSGKLEAADYERFVPEFERPVLLHGKLRAFCKPFTRATVRYFDHTAAAEARQWLGAA